MGTTLGRTAEENRLRVQVTQDDIDRMVTYPAPTYVVGIDVNSIGVVGFGRLLGYLRDQFVRASMNMPLRVQQAPSTVGPAW
jgi:hypothetical protein